MSKKYVFFFKKSDIHIKKSVKIDVYLSKYYILKPMPLLIIYAAMLVLCLHVYLTLCKKLRNKVIKSEIFEAIFCVHKKLTVFKS